MKERDAFQGLPERIYILMVAIGQWKWLPGKEGVDIVLAGSDMDGLNLS